MSGAFQHAGDGTEGVEPRDEGRTVNLSLISHTNAGKTTLVRTLLGQDVGEVRDAAHVTEVATGYVMLQHQDDTLMLWDTPGFGDTARLLNRLKLSGNPISWLLTQAWDRFRERPLWSSQQAVRNARDRADVVLYLVNASEHPSDAGYVALEMEILSWIGKPVVFLLNQMGPPRVDLGLEEERWRAHLCEWAVVREVLTLDAFARCWVQEGTLLRSVSRLLEPDKQAAFSGLSAAWREKSLERFHNSMGVLARQLANAASDREPVTQAGWEDKLGGVLRSFHKEERPEARRAMEKLAERLDNGVRASTEQLIRLHGLSGNAASEVLRRLQNDYKRTGPAQEGLAAIVGGLLSGAAGGLAADLAVGGLTLGGGMLVGGVLGALAAGGAARGYNLVRGDQKPAVRWSEESYRHFVHAAILRYLAVAHFGRGRGEFDAGEHPAFWQAAVDDALRAPQVEIQKLWEDAVSLTLESLKASAQEFLTRQTAKVLVQLYPECVELFAGRADNSGPA